MPVLFFPAKKMRSNVNSATCGCQTVSHMIMLFLFCDCEVNIEIAIVRTIIYFGISLSPTWNFCAFNMVLYWFTGVTWCSSLFQSPELMRDFEVYFPFCSYILLCGDKCRLSHLRQPCESPWFKSDPPFNVIWDIMRCQVLNSFPLFFPFVLLGIG